MDKNREKRFTASTEASLKTVRGKDGDPVKIVGYFAKFNRDSENLGGFIEIIEPGFFREALKGSDVVDLFNHDNNIPLGRESVTGEGSLKVEEDEIGLRYELTPVDTVAGRDVVKLIDTGVIKGNSFGFSVNRDGDSWAWDEEKGLEVRTLKAGGCRKLYDGSQVIFPAYPDTDVALRSMNEHKKAATGEDIEEENINIDIDLLLSGVRRI
jgi:HK97 family phage prohead protease